MDGRVFDQLAKRVGQGTSRRTAVQGAAASALAAVLGRLGLEEAAAACAQIGDSCVNRDCCRCTGAKCRGAQPKCKCIGGLTACPNQDTPRPRKLCVNTENDELNCGRCGKSCKRTERCANGRCVDPCKNGCPPGASSCSRSSATCKVQTCPPGADICNHPYPGLRCGESCGCFGTETGSFCGRVPYVCGKRFCANDQDCEDEGFAPGSKCIPVTGKCSCTNNDCGYAIPKATACVEPCEIMRSRAATSSKAEGRGGPGTGKF